RRFMSLTDYLGPKGLIAQALKSYEPRPQQQEMAEAVAAALAERRHLVVEAGTGVGKRFAYLVPAILATTAHKDFRGVIPTHTISHHQHVVLTDIPLLESVLPPRFRAVLVKGRSNYLSFRRLRVAHQRQASLLANDLAVQQLIQIGRWSRQTADGSRSDL